MSLPTKETVLQVRTYPLRTLALCVCPTTMIIYATSVPAHLLQTVKSVKTVTTCILTSLVNLVPPTVTSAEKILSATLALPGTLK